jgi:hypothetical protein
MRKDSVHCWLMSWCECWGTSKLNHQIPNLFLRCFLGLMDQVQVGRLGLNKWCFWALDIQLMRFKCSTGKLVEGGQQEVGSCTSELAIPVIESWHDVCNVIGEIWCIFSPLIVINGVYSAFAEFICCIYFSYCLVTTGWSRYILNIFCVHILVIDIDLSTGILDRMVKYWILSDVKI